MSFQLSRWTCSRGKGSFAARPAQEVLHAVQNRVLRETTLSVLTVLQRLGVRSPWKGHMAGPCLVSPTQQAQAAPYESARVCARAAAARTLV